MANIAIAVKLARDVQFIRYCQLAGTFVALYDHVITIHQEIELVWRKSWSMSKMLFLWNRYFGGIFLLSELIVLLSSSPSHESCVYIDLLVRLSMNLLSFLVVSGFGIVKYFYRARSLGYSWFRFQGWGSAVVIWSMQIIMQLRIYAMYSRSRRILILLIVCFAVEIGSMSAILALSFRYMTGFQETVLGMRVCLPRTAPFYSYAIWIPLIVFECLLFILALRVGLRHVKQMRTVERRSVDMLGILVRDSIFYFLATLTTYIATAIVWIAVPSGWMALPEGFSLAVTCIMGCRLVLNLRDAYFSPPANFMTDHSTPDTVDRLRALPRTISRNARFSLRHPFRGAITPVRKTSNVNTEALRFRTMEAVAEGRKSGKSGRPKSADSSVVPEISWKWDERIGRLDDVSDAGSHREEAQVV